jgi:hypothetical protein
MRNIAVAIVAVGAALAGFGSGPAHAQGVVISTGWYSPYYSRHHYYPRYSYRYGYYAPRRSYYRPHYYARHYYRPHYYYSRPSYRSYSGDDWVSYRW